MRRETIVRGLLATKLFAPPARPGLVARPHLVRRLREGMAGKLTLIAAPAGFGKTTLVSEWIASLNAKNPAHKTLVAWLSLEADDNDPLRYWSYVIAALDTIQPGSGAAPLALLYSPQPPPIEAVLTSLLNGLSALPADMVLVLDDCHEIATPAIHQGTSFLLDHLPPRAHLVITTRSDPPLPLTRLRARRQLVELRMADLRFTPAEAAAFLTDVMELPLTADDAAVLEARTEGWIAGLQFAALAMRDRDDLAGFVSAFAGSNRFVVDYLAEEVYNRLPYHLQSFLLETSILDRLCGPLCDVVLLGRTENQAPSTKAGDAGSRFSVLGSESYSQLLLEELERANLFLVPLDDRREWYRYHQLFAEVLRGRLASGAGAAVVAALHRRAAAWLEQQNLLPEAIRHALAAGAWEDAAGMIERVGPKIFLLGAQQYTIATWLAALPADLSRVRPKLAVLQAWVLTERDDFDGAERWVAEAERALGRVAPASDDENTRGEIAAIRALLAALHIDHGQVIAYAQQALASIHPDNQAPRILVTMALGFAAFQKHDRVRADQAFVEAAAIGRAAGYEYLTVAVEVGRAYLYRVQGALGAASAICRQTLDQMGERGRATALAAGIALVGLADLLRERNDLDEALRCAAEGAARCDELGNSDLVLIGAIVLVRVRQARGDLDGAFSQLRHAQQLAQQHHIVWAVPMLGAVEAQLWLAQGDLATVALLALASRLVPVPSEYQLGPIFLVYIYEHVQIAPIQVLMAQSRAAGDQALLRAALNQLQELRRSAESGELCWLRIKAHALEALAHHMLGDAGAALEALRSALALAAPEGYVRVFADEGAPMAELLAHVAGRKSRVASYARQLLAAFPDFRLTGDEGKQKSDLVEPLTERELEVLRLVAAGKSNTDIAETLILSVGTVKKHINNIFGKLAVSSRTQAVAHARDLGLL